MASQSWTITNAILDNTWQLFMASANISDEAVIAALRPSDATDTIYPQRLAVRRNDVSFSFAVGPTAQDPIHLQHNLSDLFLSQGTITITLDGTSAVLKLSNSTDTTEPYDWRIDTDERTALAALQAAVTTGSNAGTLTLDDNALPTADAPTPVIRAVPSGDENTTTRLSATVPASTEAKPYDTITYAWKVSGGTLNDATLASPVWTRPAVSANTSYDIDLEITVNGTGTNAVNATSDTALASTVTAVVRNVLPVADAPAVVINPVSSGQEETDVVLSAALTGGTYDTLRYQWSVDEGALDNVNAPRPVWTRPAVSADKTVGINLVITANGTGTRARNSTSDTATAAEVNAAVTDTPVVLPVADAPTVVINAVAAGVEETTVKLSSSETGGTYDTIVYAWTVDSGTLDDPTLAEPTWTRPAINTASTTVDINLEITVEGTGIAARSGTSDTATAAEVDATVTDTPLPVADAPAITINAVPSGREGTTARLSAVVPASTAAKPYDTATFRWTVSGGTLNNRANRSPVWTRPIVSGDSSYNIDLRVTFAGTGTNARNGTSDIANARRVTASVLDTVVVLPNASAPIVAINSVEPGVEETEVQLSASITGGAYDSIIYDWQVSGGSLDDAAAITPTWTRPEVDADADYDIDLDITVRGAGTTAQNNTSAQVSATTRPARVTNTPEPEPEPELMPTPEAPTVQNRGISANILFNVVELGPNDFRTSGGIIILGSSGHIGEEPPLIYGEDWSTLAWAANDPNSFPIKSLAYKQRRLYIHPELNVIATYAGTFDTFRIHAIPTAADSFDAELTIDNGFEIIDAIAMPGGLFIFTDVAVLQVPGEIPLSADGFPLENLQLPGIHHILGPLKTKDKLVYLDNTGRDVRAVVQQNEKAVYGSTDLTALTNLVSAPKAWCYSEDIIWVAQGRDLLSCTYYPEQNVLAWMKHNSNDGTADEPDYASFEDCAAVLDDVYFVIERNGEWYIERFADATETNLESDAQYGTPEFTMLPFRTADAPGQGELEIVLENPVDIQGGYVQYLNSLGSLTAEIVGTGQAVPFEIAETHGIFRLASLPEGGLPSVNELDPALRIEGAAVISSLQILVDAEVNPLPITRG